MLLLQAAAWGAPLATGAQTSAPQAPADSALDARTRDVASQLRCPVCQGESIEASPSALAQEMRTLVRQQLAEGRTPDEVKAYFVSKYGEWVLLQPRAAGVNLAVYVLPIVMLLAGAAVVAASVRRWTRGASAAAPGAEDAGEDAQAEDAAPSAR